MLWGAFANSGPAIIFTDSSLATRAAGAWVKAAVCVRVTCVAWLAFAYSCPRIRTMVSKYQVIMSSNLPEDVQSAFVPQGLVEQGSKRHSENGSPM